MQRTCKLLNLGCGSVYHPAWINLDIVSHSPHIQACDLRQGLPFADNSFAACYSSHLVEHLTLQQAHQLIKECYRILQSQGIIRLAVPDLEKIAKTYLEVLDKAAASLPQSEANYDWMMLELCDQMVRHIPGGEMGKFLADSHLTNQDFILSRIGQEAEQFWSAKTSPPKSFYSKLVSQSPRWWLAKIRLKFAQFLVRIIAGKETYAALLEGLFRNSGEVHRWMYDRYSLHRLLTEAGFVSVRICQADISKIPDFNAYQLDTIAGKIRKPDSLFMEGRKP